jgi:hypothetical protein
VCNEACICLGRGLDCELGAGALGCVGDSEAGGNRVKICEACPTEIGGKYQRFCDPCRSKRRRRHKKFVSNERIDEQVRKIYLEHPDSKTHPGVSALALRIGWPKWALLKRGRELGLARTKEKPWSEPELSILERCAWKSDERISLKLKEKGFVRSRTAVHLKLRRMRFKKGMPYFTANGLALALGIDSHLVVRWIREKKLYAKTRESEPVAAQRGDTWMIHENDVRRFLLGYPTTFDLRKVDQVWFMDLISQGVAA